MATRRQFLKSGLAATVTTAALSPLVVAAAETKVLNAVTGATAAGRGTLAMVGFGGKRHSSQQGQANSVITTLDLDSGHYRQGWLAMPSAHSVLKLAPGAYLCLPLDGRVALVVDQEFREIARLACPTGYLFSGHGVVVASQHRALLSLRRQDARSFADHGCLAVVALPDGSRSSWLRSQSDVPIASMFDSGGD
ncbi:MAG: hypothetical protein NTZ90_09200 [Proteobacteria bacterium]|nr:hypothetical protein [Pseudomonadota bacterium]